MFLQISLLLELKKAIFGSAQETDINFMLDKDRSELQKSNSRKVVIKGIEGNKETMLFDSISSCITFLNNIAPSNKTTLCRHIESGKPYNGGRHPCVNEIL